jgi:hypothetical protein
VSVLTLFADGAESLWDEPFPKEVRVLPDDLARLDELLSDPELLVPIAIRWKREFAQASRFSDRERPSLAMETYVRLMVLKQRYRWGVSVVGGGGVGLDSSAQVLSDLAVGAGAGRVDGRFMLRGRPAALWVRWCRSPIGLGVSEHTVYYWISHGQLAARRTDGNRVYIPFPPEVEEQWRQNVATSSPDAALKYCV